MQMRSTSDALACGTVSRRGGKDQRGLLRWQWHATAGDAHTIYEKQVEGNQPNDADQDGILLWSKTNSITLIAASSSPVVLLVLGEPNVVGVCAPLLRAGRDGHQMQCDSAHQHHGAMCGIALQSPVGQWAGRRRGKPAPSVTPFHPPSELKVHTSPIIL